ncbi:MAG: hypothetical protein J6B62_02290 [Bacteroidales bacterium]|nr:hypothetical protein [Bacteroidales bacterium]
MKTDYRTLLSLRKGIMYAAAILLAGAVSCTKEIPEEPEGPGTEKPSGPEEPEKPDTPVPVGNIELTARITPIAVTEGEPYQINWKTSDKISIWTSDEADRNIDMSLKSETTDIFTGDLATTNEQFSIYGIYPYSETYTDLSAIPVNIPSAVSQTIDFGSTVTSTKILFGKGDITASDKQHCIEFKSPLAYLDIIVDGTDSYFSDGIIEKLTISADIPFVGDMTYDFEGGNLTPVSDDNGKELVINYPDVATIASSQETSVAIAPITDLTESGFRIVLSLTNGQEITFRKFDIASFEASGKYTILLSDINRWLEEYKADAVGYDLVAANGGERANCYIISHGGRYRFATDYVNPKKDIAFDKSTITGADWLWSTGEESLVKDIVYGNSGNIFFYVYPNTNGNAVIAATNDSGEIVWSWHIWMTTDEKPLEPSHYNRNNAWLMSDRNLGATSDKEGDIGSYGLYYQWGRKDPFPGANMPGSTAAGKENGNFGSWTAQTTANARFSNATFLTKRNTETGDNDIAYATRNPMHNIHYTAEKAGNNAGTNTWAYNMSLEEFRTLWNSTTDKKNKTIYDPCPAGYCVPVSTDYAWRYFTKFSPEKDTGIAGYIFDATDGSDPNQGGYSYYPPTGYRNSGQLTNLGYTGLYWSATIPDGSNTPRCLALEYKKAPKNTTNQPQRGLAVRCMKIQ